MKEKKTKFVLLGFLLHESLSGYQIGELIRQSTNHFWQESDASIYPTLKRLKKELLVSSIASNVGKRKREILPSHQLEKRPSWPGLSGLQTPTSTGRSFC